ncbi:MAG: cell division/cell wall cluster transcriptional repressor MraZ [Gammaproteobacteria bacterium]|nr:cell division/cell wall cluster transcriptional repressor MraZ [Gammaproteobacteria bacterium]|tara:strand:- start:3398 stop:3856 length:459 start_codon:yes stop_codon:yes gene_type:complete
MFRGINTATIDGKGRMAVPARFREAVLLNSSGEVVVTIDMRERCLLMYPLPQWEVVQDKLERLSNIGPQARLLQRLLIGHATDLNLDAQGRLLVPNILREYGEINKKVVLVGQGNKIEMWSDEHWQAQMKNWLSDGADELLSGGDDFTGLSV